METRYFRNEENNKIKRLSKKFLSRFFLETNHASQNSILVAGTGRSGTTWVSDIITSQIPSRLMFEPFYNEIKVGFENISLYQYMRPEQDDRNFYKAIRKVITGRVRHEWIDRHNRCIFPRYRLIKAVRANLFLKWLHVRFPDVPILFLVRHPCAVVLSRIELGWGTDSEIDAFLMQDNLLNDWLIDKIDLIRGAQTEAEKHAVIWCVHHLVPLEQFLPGEFSVIFYENLIMHPQEVINDMLRAIGRNIKPINIKSIRKPSITTSQKSSIITGEDMLTRWKNRLTHKEIDSILKIVDEFGLKYLYEDSIVPTNKAEFFFE